MAIAWTIAAFAAGIYCIVRGVADLRQRKYIWGALGIVSAAVFLAMPVPDRADLPTLSATR